MDPHPDLPSSQSSDVSTESSSLYFRRRFDGNKTRREAIEQRFKGKSPRSSLGSHPVATVTTTATTSSPMLPGIPDPSTATDNNVGPYSPPKLQPKPFLTKREGGLPFEERKPLQRNNSQFTSELTLIISNVHDDPRQQSSDTTSATTKPQHMQTTGTPDKDNTKYYRVVYRGVVSLLSEPSLSSPRNGAYVSYGEVVASTCELYADVGTTGPTLGSIRNGDPTTPTRSKTGQQAPAQSSPSTPVCSPGGTNPDQKVIRVDRVLTGGYSMDAVDTHVGPNNDQTPKRGNSTFYPNVTTTLSVVGPSALPLAEAPPEEVSLHRQGYLFAYRKEFPILVRIIKPPRCESGNFMYKVVSSTPLAVHMGPCGDAPTTQGMLVPGTVHEVCLRVVESSVCYLRLSRRRGWVADRLAGDARSRLTSRTVMKEVIEFDALDDGATSVASNSASSVATPVAMAQHRHRPPRRRRINVNKDTINSHASLPRHVPGPGAPSNLSEQQSRYDTAQISFEAPPNTHHHDRSYISPSSNVSLLSDESSLDQSMTRHAGGVLTPDRSVARSFTSSSGTGSQPPSFFLMRVNAPRGLKILDAPQFQVNNLIHGNHPTLASPSKDPMPTITNTTGGGAGNQSIFQTMAGHHTTTLTSKIGNPAVFDSNTKARKLPRGSVFEASKRMEAAGAFSQGSGLIKLSDNSGWAIVPRRDELDEQYRNNTGGLSGIKEGEASRAFVEVGNAILDDQQTPVFIRVRTRGGISVSLPPPSSLLSDDETSPTSSAGGSSAMGGSTAGSGRIPSQDSDVASSVGSSFLDAMFRTPRKKDPESAANDPRRDTLNPNASKVQLLEKPSFSTVLPCGMFVEVERWTSPSEPEQGNHMTEFARLRGGQGWIPRYLNGKAVAETISPPESRFGSFWFRVQDRNGIKVRLGPSGHSPSIKSEEGVYFRFECGEFLRSSEVVTFFRQNAPSECYAKLYRNRHVRLYAGHGETRPLPSLTVQAEWVQVFKEQELYLEECATDPRIERHRQGWRYNVVLDARIQVRKGPSFEAHTNGVVLLGGESVLVNERVTGPDDTINWLRLRDGQGWVHNVGMEGEALMIPHSLRHRKGPLGRPAKPGRHDQEHIAYNTIIARLFHNDLSEEGTTPNVRPGQSRRRWNS